MVYETEAACKAAPRGDLSTVPAIVAEEKAANLGEPRKVGIREFFIDSSAHHGRSRNLPDGKILLQRIFAPPERSTATEKPGIFGNSWITQTGWHRGCY
jgi:hypothetical protein